MSQGKPFLRRERSDAAIFNPAEAALLGCGPQRPIAIELQTGDMPLAQPISGCVQRADLAILEIRHAPAASESKPDSALAHDESKT